MNRNKIIDALQLYLIENAKQVCKSYSSKSFNTFIHRKESVPFLNYAIPTRSISDEFYGEFETLKQIFKDNDRCIRLEFLEEFAPLLPQLLTSVGLKEECRNDFMICTKASFLKPIAIDGFRTIPLSMNSSDKELKDFKLVQEQSFVENSPLTLDQIDVEEVLLSIGSGQGFVGYIENTAVSASQYTSIINEVAELVSVSTLYKYRQNGLGSTISAIAVDKAFANGASIICLSAADAHASKIYTNIGFKKIAMMLVYS